MSFCSRATATSALPVLLAVGTLLLIASRPAAAQTITIDFDEVASGTLLSIGAYDAIGVHFNQALATDDGTLGSLPSSAPNAAFGTTPGGAISGGDVTGFFTGPVSSVTFISVFAGDAGGDTDTVTLNAFNAANALVDSATFTGASAQTLSVSGVGITRFEILQTNAIGIDDFRFTVTPTASAAPEPGSLTLLALTGIPLFGAVARRRKATV